MVNLSKTFVYQLDSIAFNLYILHLFVWHFIWKRQIVFLVTHIRFLFFVCRFGIAHFIEHRIHIGYHHKNHINIICILSMRFADYNNHIPLEHNYFYHRSTISEWFTRIKNLLSAPRKFLANGNYEPDFLKQI